MCPEGGGGTSLGRLVRTAEVGEQAMPPIPRLRLISAAALLRGEDLPAPKAPLTRRTCGEPSRDDELVEEEALTVFPGGEPPREGEAEAFALFGGGLCETRTGDAATPNPIGDPAGWSARPPGERPARARRGDRNRASYALLLAARELLPRRRPRGDDEADDEEDRRCLGGVRDMLLFFSAL